MHEFGIAREIVEICAARAGASRVVRVQVEIGRLAAVLPEAVRFCFDACANGTVVEGATLDVVETPGRAVCVDCDSEVPLAEPASRCGCGSANLRVIAGEELKVREMELA